MAAHATRSFAPVDAAWLHMDGATQRATITALLRFDGRIDCARLRQLVRDRLLCHERFRSRAVDRAVGLPRWQVDERFDLDRHLRERTLPPPGDDATLRTVVSDLVSTPLDHERPLWALDLVRGAPGGDALVARIHHCVADGIALVSVLLGLIDESEGSAPTQVGWTGERTAKLGDRLAQEARAARTLGRTLLLPSDPETALRGSLSGRKEVAWTEPVALALVKERAHAVSGTVNDMIVAACAGGLRAWAERRGTPFADDVRALVPVFVRGGREGHVAQALGNAFGLVYAKLPVTLDDEGARLAESKRRMDAIKRTPEPSNALGILGALGRIATPIEHAAVDLLTKKASLVLTNVPGPPVPVHLAGAEVRSMDVWAPFAGRIALGLTAMSYRGELRVGVLADACVIPDPEALAREIGRELAGRSTGFDRA